MPNWGFSVSMRKAKPYGLAEWLLEPSKVVTDPIHGDIFLTELERLILDTPPMQRLRRVRQLGTTHLVYPGATHTRFAHSLGAVRVVQTLLDTALTQRSGNHPVPDLFEEWEDEARQAESDMCPDSLDARLANELRLPPWRIVFDRKVGEATVIARLGALLHDIGHLPYGHTIEDDLRLLTSHDRGEARLKSIWTEVCESCVRQVQRRAERSGLTTTQAGALGALDRGERLFGDLQHLILSSKRDADENKINAAKELVEYPFVADLVGNTICADLLDYLQRDHVYTGLPVSLGKRYLSSFYITPESTGGIYKRRMALLTHREGRERKDIVTEILKHLRYRYELQARVLVHHTKLAADAMVGKMFELWMAAERERLGRDKEALESLSARIPEEFEPKLAKERRRRIDRAARWRLEQLLLQFGDDGILEQLRADAEASENAATLASDLIDRNLYKLAANAAGHAGADDLFLEFGDAEQRHKLEAEACSHAGIAADWHLVLWVPDPDMRLKLAELLVNDGKGIAKFKDKFPLGSDIYAAHEALWTISVFVHPTVSVEATRSALAKLGQVLGVSWDRHEDALGNDPSVAPEHLASYRAVRGHEQGAEVIRLTGQLKSRQLAARGGEPLTQEELDRQAKAIRGDWTNGTDEDEL